MMKKVKAFLAALLLVLTAGIFFPTIPAQAAGKVTFSGELDRQLTESDGGSKVVYSIYISNNPGIAGYKLTLDYDKDLLSIAGNKSVSDKWNEDGTMMKNIEAGTLLWYAVENCSENGLIATVEFTVADGVKGGDYKISLSSSDKDLVYVDDAGEAVALPDGGKGSDLNFTIAHAGYTDGESKEATCTEAGYTKKVCTGCGEEVKTEIPALGHNFKDEGKEATCTEAGYTKKTCTRCGEAGESKDIPALGHKYEDESKEATCTEAGYTRTVCTVCGDVKESKDIPALGHNYTKVVTEPTCEEQGYTTYTCSVCKESEKKDLTDALGHSWDEGKVIKEATDEADGEKQYTCTRCEKTRTEKIPALTHTWDEGKVTKEATCTEAGEKTYTCTDCGKTYTEEIPMTAHSYKETVTKPNCTEKGYTTYTCEKCGKSYADKYTDAMGHDCVYKDNNDGTHTVSCKNCSYSNKEAHSYTNNKCVCGAQKAEEQPSNPSNPGNQPSNPGNNGYFNWFSGWWNWIYNGTSNNNWWSGWWNGWGNNGTSSNWSLDWLWNWNWFWR